MGAERGGKRMGLADGLREGTRKYKQSMGIWVKLKVWGVQQTHGKNHASVVGRMAGRNGDVYHAHGWW